MLQIKMQILQQCREPKSTFNLYNNFSYIFFLINVTSLETFLQKKNRIKFLFKFMKFLELHFYLFYEVFIKLSKVSCNFFVRIKVIFCSNINLTTKKNVAD